MRKHFKSILAAMLILTVCMTIFAPAVFAEEVTLSGINITIEQNEHPAAHDEAYNVVIKGFDGAPMPEGAVDGEYTVVVSNSDTVPFPAISYDHQGVYEYTVEQKAGTTERWTYDDSIYYMTVYVINDENGEVVIQTVIYKDEESDATKCDEILFTNIYDPIETSVTFEFKKTVGISKKNKITDYNTPETGVFSFELRDEAGTLLETVTNVEGTVTFAPLTYDELGTHTYTVTEVQHIVKEFKYGELTVIEPMMIFDKDTVTVTVEVYLEDGDYAANIFYAQDDTSAGTDNEKNEFVNIISIPNPGDSTNLTVWIALFCVSLVAVVALLVIGKNRKNQ